MGKDKVVSKAITPAEIARALASGSITTAQAQAMFNGVIPIGDYNGIASILDLNLLVNEPLILAEKQWTEDRVDTRNGECHVTLPALSVVNKKMTAEITVPAGEVWYLCEHEIRIPQVAALTDGTITVNFRVSSFPKVNSADKLYYDITDPQVYLTGGDAVKCAAADVGGTNPLAVSFGEIAGNLVYDHKLLPFFAAALSEYKRDFRDGDELNTELRLVAGDKLTLEATVTETFIGAGAAVAVYLRVYGRVGKLLVEE